MPQEVDLAGMGLSPFLAHALGNQATTAVATGTGSQANSVLLKSTLVQLTTAGGADSFILPLGTQGALIGTPYWVSNLGATSGVVFCPVGHTLNGSSNGSQTIAQNKIAVFIQMDRTTWFSIVRP